MLPKVVKGNCTMKNCGKAYAKSNYNTMCNENFLQKVQKPSKSECYMLSNFRAPWIKGHLFSARGVQI